MSLYDKLPVDLLSEFYFAIRQNIEKGILTEKMYIEIELIQAAAEKKGFIFSEDHKSNHSKSLT
ncbi:hypothetical protein [Halalkalibacter flavus]|uniref:hypothetical protein n=1 Tax=Halalkalibacter flavus TaxID=3090668 RepID=UPI002FC8FB6B